MKLAHVKNAPPATFVTVAGVLKDMAAAVVLGTPVGSVAVTAVTGVPVAVVLAVVQEDLTPEVAVASNSQPQIPKICKIGVP
jgi:hypothetical protein